ncbi:MAG: CRISPR-associated endoribonuclease Cas6 [Clostridiaceae bacterium]|nr:CRISPR-associated endoribonuclease Cas6 [Clostridiaceae bacterium]
MRLKLLFNCKEDIILTVDYNYHIQSFIYKNISNDMADFLHQKGYCYNERNFKLFTYSKLFGKCTFDKDNKTFCFKPPVTLYISSPVDNFIVSFANHILTNNDIYISKNRLEVESIEMERDKPEKEIYVKTLSPIVVYSTLFDAAGGKYTCYFMPGEAKFKSLIQENLRKKTIAFGLDPQDGILNIEPIGRIEQKIITYKGFIIKGSEGKFKLKANENLINMALNSGLGSKNSQGFGCIIRI